MAEILILHHSPRTFKQPLIHLYLSLYAHIAVEDQAIVLTFCTSTMTKVD